MTHTHIRGESGSEGLSQFLRLKLVPLYARGCVLPPILQERLVQAVSSS